MTKEDVLKFVYDNNVRFVKLWFTDILGFAKSFSISIDELEGPFRRAWIRRLVDPGFCANRRKRHDRRA